MTDILYDALMGFGIMLFSIFAIFALHALGVAFYVAGRFYELITNALEQKVFKDVPNKRNNLGGWDG